MMDKIYNGLGALISILFSVLLIVAIICIIIFIVGAIMGMARTQQLDAVIHQKEIERLSA
jgi:hypothetical protein